MKALILNTTGNEKGFEDQLCKNIKDNVNADVNILSKRGIDLYNSSNLIDGYSIIVLVAHGNNESSSTTILNTGLDLGLNIPKNISKMLNSPTVLNQILGRNSAKYILFFCACSALSSELLVSVIDDYNCIGTISSKVPISKYEFKNIAKIINELESIINKKEISKAEVDSILLDSAMPDLFYDENNMRVIDEEA